MRGILIGLPISLLVWAVMAFVGVSLHRAASRGELPDLHLREVP